jgi:hypothetical protein
MIYSIQDPDPTFQTHQCSKCKIAIYLSLGLHKGWSKQQGKPSALKREHPAIQKIKFTYFFLYLWVIFALLGSDTDSGTPIESGSRNRPTTLLLKPLTAAIKIAIHLSLGFHKERPSYWGSP